MTGPDLKAKAREWLADNCTLPLPHQSNTLVVLLRSVAAEARKEALGLAERECERTEAEFHRADDHDAASAAALCAIRIRALAGRKEET